MAVFLTDSFNCDLLRRKNYSFTVVKVLSDYCVLDNVLEVSYKPDKKSTHTHKTIALPSLVLENCRYYKSKSHKNKYVSSNVIRPMRNTSGVLEDITKGFNLVSVKKHSLRV